MTASTLTLQGGCFQIKTSFFPCTILQLIRYDLDAFEQQIQSAIQQAPVFFAGSPVILDLEKVNALGTLNFSKIKQFLLKNNLIPIGIRSGSPEQIDAAAQAGLPLFNFNKTISDHPNKKSENAHQALTTKLVTTPVRSGMQIYAKEGDLVVVAQVSQGAELLADGNIHIYGPLRGRALAGVKGNTEARIFCHTLEAELISIAGYYLTKEELHQLPKQDGTIQVYLEDEEVKIKLI